MPDQPGVDEFNGSFDYMDLNETSEADLREALEVGGVLIAITNEVSGGIVAYTFHEHAAALVRALNAAEGEYEAEMTSDA